MKKNRCYILAMAFSLQNMFAFVFTLNAQFEIKNGPDLDTLPAVHYQKRGRNFINGSCEWTLAQVIPWSTNRYIRGANFARINFKSVATNFPFKNWQWDDNQFFTNQFSHPFHGSLYFNAFRSNGYNFWQSASASFAGTYWWEVVMENHLPAPNDIINTAFGGIAIGEMTHRVSKLLIGRNKRKWRYYTTDPASFIINPMQGFTRIVTGKWGKPLRDANQPAASLSITADYRLGKETGKPGSNNTAAVSVDLDYGNKFNLTNTPFDHFTLHATFSNDDSGTLNALQVEGDIIKRNLKARNGIQQALRLTLNYDFMKNHSFKYGADGLRIYYHALLTLSNKIQFEEKIGIGYIILGAIPNTYMLYGEGRDYDYCTGATSHLKSSLRIDQRLDLSYQFDYGLLATVNGFNSTHRFTNSTARVNVNITKQLSVCAGLSKYIFDGNYENFAGVHQQFSIRNIGISYVKKL